MSHYKAPSWSLLGSTIIKNIKFHVKSIPINRLKLLAHLQVQVIPWLITDSHHVRPGSSQQKVEPNRTVFVAGLHGAITAGTV